MGQYLSSQFWRKECWLERPLFSLLGMYFHRFIIKSTFLRFSYVQILPRSFLWAPSQISQYTFRSQDYQRVVSFAGGNFPPPDTYNNLQILLLHMYKCSVCVSLICPCYQPIRVTNMSLEIWFMSACSMANLSDTLSTELLWYDDYLALTNRIGRMKH